MLFFYKKNLRHSRSVRLKATPYPHYQKIKTPPYHQCGFLFFLHHTKLSLGTYRPAGDSAGEYKTTGPQSGGRLLKNKVGWLGIFLEKRKRRGAAFCSTRLVHRSRSGRRVISAYLPVSLLPQLSMPYGCDSPRATVFLRTVIRCAGPRVGHHSFICIPQSASAAVGPSNKCSLHSQEHLPSSRLGEVQGRSRPARHLLLLLF